MGKHKPRLPKLCCVHGCRTKISDHGSYICRYHLRYMSDDTRKTYYDILSRTNGIETDYFNRKELIEIVKIASREIAEKQREL